MISESISTKSFRFMWFPGYLNYYRRQKSVKDISSSFYEADITLLLISDQDNEKKITKDNYSRHSCCPPISPKYKLPSVNLIRDESEP